MHLDMHIMPQQAERFLPQMHKLLMSRNVQTGKHSGNIQASKKLQLLRKYSITNTLNHLT
jgi:hypothetical protein